MIIFGAYFTVAAHLVQEVARHDQHLLRCGFKGIKQGT